MTYSVHAASLRTVLYDNWQTTPIEWPNTAFTPPEKSAWVRFTIQDADKLSASIGAPGANLARQAGILYLQIFTPAGNGDGEAVRLAEALAAIYNTEAFGSLGLHFREPASIKRVGVSGAWYQVNLLVPFVSETYQ